MQRLLKVARQHGTIAGIEITHDDQPIVRVDIPALDPNRTPCYLTYRVSNMREMKKAV